ncbi:MAG: alpha-galactosidase [Treponema sp.]|jgi:alpha-galactosidase|nr:alpha-galactosidase [Treponema sp.]
MIKLQEKECPCFAYTEDAGFTISALGGIHTVPSPRGGIFCIKTSRGFYDAGQAKPAMRKTDDGLRLEYGLTGGLSVSVQWKTNAAGIVERLDTIANKGDSPVIIYGYCANIVFTGSFEIYTQSNYWCHENQGHWEALSHGVREIATRGGRSCLANTPYMALRDTITGKSLALHTAVLGDWSIKAEVSEENRLVLSTGPAPGELAYSLEPGGKALFSSTVFESLPDGTPESGSAIFHRHLLSDPLNRKPKEIPVEFNTWFYDFDNLAEEKLSRQLEAAAALGCEVFTVDAGWYGQLEGRWASQTGDWREKTDGAFKGKMRAFADKVRARGLGFGIWIEPERFEKNAPVVLEHPDWFLEDEGSNVYPDLDRQETAAYIFDMISEVIDRYNALWVKIDFNHILGKDPHGKVHMGYMKQFYHIMDDLREKYPRLILEGCSSGGMRFDFEIQKHYDVCFLTDTVNPFDVLRIGEGVSPRCLPGKIIRWCCFENPGTIPHYGHDEPMAALLTPKKAIWDEVENIDADFALKVALQGHLSFSGELAGLDDETKEKIKKAIAFAKEHRNLIRYSVLHQLTPIKPMDDRGGWSASYLCRPDGSAGIFYAYRLDSPASRMNFTLPEDSISGSYIITDYDTGETVTAGAEELCRQGINIEITQKNRAALFVFKRG